MKCAARGRGTPCTASSPTKRCGLCGAVAYCSLSHQLAHWNDHKEECARLEQQMKRAYILNNFPFTFSVEVTLTGSKQKQNTRCSFLTSMGLHQMGLWKAECHCGTSVSSSDELWINDGWHLSSALCPCAEPRSTLSTCLSNWTDYYQWRCLPFHSPVALLLHWPLTIYHSFNLSSIQSSSLKDSSKLHVHYLGPDKELLQLPVIGELRALFPGVQLHIDLVGPSVPQFRNGEKISLCSYAHCSEKSCPCKFSCMNSGSGAPNAIASSVTIQLHKGLYHDRYGDIVKDSIPQLIVAPNAGVAAYSSWLPTIELIEQIGVPAIFSDFCEEAAHLAARCISTVTGRPLRVPIQVNPFRQPMAVEDCALYLPCYSNCFLFGM